MARNRVSELWFSSLWQKSEQKTDKAVIGVLAFEVARLMSKLVNLWNSLSDCEVERLEEEVLNLVGVRKLVSEDDDYIMDLALNEMIENLGFVARSAASLGKKCKDPIYSHFGDFVSDPIHNDFECFGWEYRWKKMKKKVKKMERFVEATMQLSQELEVLAEIEQTFRRMQVNVHHDRVKLLEFQQKVTLQHQQVKILREMSPWIRTYDYTVRLLARSIFTILERMKYVYGTDLMASVEVNTDNLTRSQSFSALMQSSVYPLDYQSCGFSAPLGRSGSMSWHISDKKKTKFNQQNVCIQSSMLRGKHPHLKMKRLSNVGSLKGCVQSERDSHIMQSCKPTGSGSMRLSSVCMIDIDQMEGTNTKFYCNNKIHYKLSLFQSKGSLLSAPQSTVGGAALALHYANVIILIEKLSALPHLIDRDARDDLYNMLPTTIKTTLRTKLKSYSRATALPVNDRNLAADWNLAVVHILEWLSPLAHNMIRWQSERSFEKQDVVSGMNVLLVQTLYFANQAKTEAAIVELLIGLNYICRVGQETIERSSPTLASSRRAYENYPFRRINIA